MKHIQVRYLFTIISMTLMMMVLTLCLVPSPTFTMPLQQTGKASQHLEKGKTLLQAGQLQAALAELTAARQLYSQANDAVGEVQTLFWIGTVYRRMGKRETALQIFQDALVLADKSEQQTATINISGTLPIPQTFCITDNSGVSVLKNDLTTTIVGTQQEIALDEATRSLMDARAQSDQTKIAYALDKLGAIYQTMMRNESALDAYAQEIHIWRTLENRLVGLLPRGGNGPAL